MNQHPRAKEMGITAGLIYPDESGCTEGIAAEDESSMMMYDVLANKRKPDITVMADSLNVMNQTGRTPSELVREWDKWEDEATRLNGENEKLKDLVRELAGAIASINRAPHHVVEVDGDDDICYYQRKEWVDWIIQLADDAIEVVT
jgi:hypothetical protein